MRIIRAFRWATAIAILLCISGCSLPLHVVFFNATGSEITVQHKGDKQELIESRIGSNSSSEIEGLLSGRFTVVGQIGKVSYEREFVPEEFVDGFGLWPFFKRKVKARLQLDGCIYLVPIEGKLQDQQKTQPEGFPLCGKAAQ